MRHSTSKEVRERQKRDRIGEETLNNQGCLMRIVEYNNSKDIVVEFQDEYKARINSRYPEFKSGGIRNPYHPVICGVGMIGMKYGAAINKKTTKEYYTWKNMLYRCYNEEYKKRYNTRQDLVCCEEWLCFENFYDWIHSQSNCKNFLEGNNWILSVDVIDKNNNIFSPQTCYLIPQNINALFFTDKRLNAWNVNELVLQRYKEYRKSHIKRIAKEEFEKNNITEQCYMAMMDYKVDLQGEK